MYSKQEAALLREQFWIAFGRYMKPVLSAEGLPVHWVNYKTGVKHIYFRMDAGRSGASVAIELRHPDPAERKHCLEQFRALGQLFRNIAGTDWDWQAVAVSEAGMPLSRIVSSLDQVSVYQQEDWPQLISFLKPRIIALDHFWTEVKPAFELY
jgi:hypothetical protein